MQPVLELCHVAIDRQVLAEHRVCRAAANAHQPTLRNLTQSGQCRRRLVHHRFRYEHLVLPRHRSLAAVGVLNCLEVISSLLITSTAAVSLLWVTPQPALPTPGRCLVRSFRHAVAVLGAPWTLLVCAGMIVNLHYNPSNPTTVRWYHYDAQSVTSYFRDLC